MKLVCVTKFTHSRVDNTCTSVVALLTFNLSSKFHFTVALDAWLPVDVYAFPQG